MTTYRVGTHHGVTIVAENDGARCGRPGHDCARGHLVAVIVDGSVELAERICALLNTDERRAYRAEPAVICPSCSHPAHMHRERDRRYQPFCVGAGPGYACTCTRTCEELNERAPRARVNSAESAEQPSVGRAGPLAIQHRPERPGSDSEGYGACTGCGDLWPCAAYRGERP